MSAKLIRRLPAVKPRRPYGVADYLEGDRDFVANNFAACVWFLNNRDRLAAQLKGA